MRPACTPPKWLLMLARTASGSRSGSDSDPLPASTADATSSSGSTLRCAPPLRCPPLTGSTPPGTYDLRLLLADQGHIPYFVYSKPLKVRVSKQNKDATPASVQGPAHIELLTSGGTTSLRPPFRLQFHASGYNLSNAAPKAPDTGHFRLMLERAGQKPEVLNFVSGQTEVWLKPPAGDYTMRLELVSNAEGDSVMSAAKPLALTVAAR